MGSCRSALGAIVGVALVAAGCSGERDAPDGPLAFCRATSEYDHQLSTRRVPLREQIRLVGDIVDAAPREVAADARAFLEALEAVRADPTTPRDDPDVRQAVENVNRYAAQGCDFYARQGGL